MRCRCTSCIFRAHNQAQTPAGCRPGCSYIQHTGKSRLKAAYQRLGVSALTDEVRAELQPENCMHYQRGQRRELDEKGILLSGSTPERAATKAPEPAQEPKPRKERVKAQAFDREEARALWEQGLNDREIGQRLGVCDTTIWAWRKVEELPPNRKETLNAVKMTELLQAGLTDAEVARELGIRAKSVEAWRNRRGIKRNPTAREREIQDRMQRRAALYEQGLNDAEMARELGIPTVTVRRWRWKLNLPENGGRVRRRLDGTKAMELYNAGLPDEKIAGELGMSICAVRKWRKRRGLPANTERCKKRSLRATWDAQGRALHAAGATDAEIARAVGRSLSAVSAWRRLRGLQSNLAQSGRKTDADL